MSDADLARAFWEALQPEGTGDSLPDGLQDAIVEAVERAREALPTAELDELAFARQLGERLRGVPDPVGSLRQRHTGDLWLASAAVQGVPEAVAQLERDHLRETRRIVAALGAPEHVVDDLLQDLRARLLLPRGERAPEISSYSGRGPLGGWLRVVATREARRMLASRRRQAGEPADALLERLVLETGKTLRGDERARHRVEVEGALRAALERLEPRERNLLRHQAVDGLSVREVARLYGVHFATVSRWTTAARDRLVGMVREEIAERLVVADHEVDSLVRSIRSEVDLSIERLLRG